MARLPARDLARIAEISDALRTFREDEPSALPSFLRDVCDLLDARRACAYRLHEDRDGRFLFDIQAAHGLPADTGDVFNRWVLNRPVEQWATYSDPLHVQPWQRNRALALGDVGKRTSVRLPIIHEVYPRVGIGDHDQLRVLVCDGPALVSWVGAFQPVPFEPWQRRLFARLVPALRRRLALEARVAEARSLRATLEAAMDAIPGAAFVIDERSVVRHANAAAAAWRSTVRAEG